MLRLKSKYPIGIDMEDENLCAVQLKETGNGPAVRGFFHQRLSEGASGEVHAPETLLPVLKAVAKHKQFSGKRAVVRLPSRSVSSFPIRFQVGNTETLEEAILREAKHHLSYPVEETVIDYPSIDSVTSGDSETYRATITAIRRSNMEQYLRVLEKAGLSVEAIDFGVSSLIRLHRHLFESTGKPVFLCNVGHTRSLLSVVSQDHILAERNIPWGIGILLDKLGLNLDLTEEKESLATLLEEYGLLYEHRENVGEKFDLNSTPVYMRRAIYQIITPYIEELVHEFHRMIAYVRSEEGNEQFEGIYIYGQGALVHQMDRYLEARLAIPTSLINPVATMPLADQKILPDPSDGTWFALAIGLAMRKVAWL